MQMGQGCAGSRVETGQSGHAIIVQMGVNDGIWAKVATGIDVNSWKKLKRKIRKTWHLKTLWAHGAIWHASGFAWGRGSRRGRGGYYSLAAEPVAQESPHTLDTDPFLSLGSSPALFWPEMGWSSVFQSTPHRPRYFSFSCFQVKWIHTLISSTVRACWERTQQMAFAMLSKPSGTQGAEKLPTPCPARTPGSQASHPCLLSLRSKPTFYDEIKIVSKDLKEEKWNCFQLWV